MDLNNFYNLKENIFNTIHILLDSSNIFIKNLKSNYCHILRVV